MITIESKQTKMQKYSKMKQFSFNFQLKENKLKEMNNKKNEDMPSDN